jgi:prephenate dehydratase
MGSIASMKAAYLGPPGTFSEEALRAFDASNKWEPVPFPTLAEAYRALASRQAAFAVLPIENSLEGTVGTTLDLLVQEPGPLIRAEKAVPIRHHLLTRLETKLEEIRTVVSHPQALAQCAQFLQSRRPSATQLAAPSTADGARQASEQPGVAAVASLAAAQRFGLTALAKDIQDEPDNTTRFVLLSAQDAPRTGRDKTSIAIALEHQPGALYDALGGFASAGINLTKLESRPSRRALGEYLFFIDFEGHRSDDLVDHVLAALRKRALRVLLLGSYPSG